MYVCMYGNYGNYGIEKKRKRKREKKKKEANKKKGGIESNQMSFPISDLSRSIESGVCWV